MTRNRFSDEELLALIEGELPEHRAKELRAAVRDGDLELAGRLIDMAEHRDFLREMKIDRSDLNPGNAVTPEGIVAASIAAAERESLVPDEPDIEDERTRRWVAPLAAGLGLAAILGIGFTLSRESDQHRLPRDIEQQVSEGRAGVLGTEVTEGDPLESNRQREEEMRRLAQELFGQDRGADDGWPDLAGTDADAPLDLPGVADPITRDPIEFASGTGLSELLSEQDFSDLVTSLEKVGVRAEARSSDPLRFAGVDALGDEREFTLEEATSLAKAGRLAIVLDETGRQPSELLAASGATGGFLAGRANRYALFTVQDGGDEPDGVATLRDSQRVRELRERTADATGQEPGVLASYSFDAAGLNRRVSDAERVTMVELIAAITSPLTSSAEGSRLRLIELPFGNDDAAPTSTDPDNPFWWLTPEADWSESATTLIPVVVR